MRKIFLDIGAYIGDSVDFFLRHHPLSEDFEIFSFECDKRNLSILKSKALPTKVIEAAAWSSGGVKHYYFGKDDGGSLYPDKKTGGVHPRQYYPVRTIDLARFIKINFHSDDYIILKLNCEGAEYEIIPHLKNKGVLDWVNLLFVQWHYGKIPSITKEKHEEASGMKKNYKWDVMTPTQEFVEYFLKTVG